MAPGSPGVEGVAAGCPASREQDTEAWLLAGLTLSSGAPSRLAGPTFAPNPKRLCQQRGRPAAQRAVLRCRGR